MDDKFKCWSTKNKKWINDFLIDPDGGLCKYGMFETLDILYDARLIENTEAKTSDDRSIYELDIIKHTKWCNGKEIYYDIGVVIFSPTNGFVMDNISYDALTPNEDTILIEKLGNVFENPELLNQLYRKGEIPIWKLKNEF